MVEVVVLVRPRDLRPALAGPGGLRCSAAEGAGFSAAMLRRSASKRLTIFVGDGAGA